MLSEGTCSSTPLIHKQSGLQFMNSKIVGCAVAYGCQNTVFAASAGLGDRQKPIDDLVQFSKCEMPTHFHACPSLRRRLLVGTG